MAQTLGNRIREVRKEHGLSQKELGVMLGVGRTTVNNIENGNQNPTVEFLIAFAKACNTSIDDLVGLNTPRDHESVLNLENLLELVSKVKSERKQADREKSADELYKLVLKMIQENSQLKNELIGLLEQIRTLKV